MPTQLTENDARQSLNAHVAAKGAEVREKFGPHIGWKELQQILRNPAYVRYPTEIVFDAAALQPGEFACALMRGERPDEGFAIHVHPLLLTQLDRVPALVLYQFVVVNYGDFASSDDAEAFGAAALGLDRDDYYALICSYVDELGEACAC